MSAQEQGNPQKISDYKMVDSGQEPKLIYHIVCHAFNEQLYRLTQLLSSWGGVLIISCDAKTPASEYERMQREIGALGHVIFTQRVPVYWGGVGVLQSQLAGVRLAVDEGISFDWLIELSGACYPIKSKAVINDYLRQRPGMNFIHHTPMTREGLGTMYEHVWDRVQYWHFRKPGRPRLGGDHIVFPRKDVFGRQPLNLIWNLMMSLFPFRRKFMPGFEPYYGGAFWSITEEMADYLVTCFRRMPQLIRAGKTMVSAEEQIFHTLFLNSPFAHKVVNDDFRYIIWERRETGGPPAYIDARDLERMRQPGKLFARKFDEKRNPGMLDVIENRFLRATHV
jgi:hypothetical protein